MHVRQAVRRLLLIVPDSDLRGSLAAQLSLAGYAVATTTTGAAAVELLGGRHVDLIVVDLETPDLEALAQDRPTFTERERPPVLCLAACEFLGTLVPALGVAVEDHVTKPCRSAELPARIQVLLRDRALPGPVLRHGDLLLDEVVCDAGARRCPTSGRTNTI